MFNYYNLNFPANYSIYSEVFRDFMCVETAKPLYNILIETWIGEEIVRKKEEDLNAYGLDMYMSEKGGTDSLKNAFSTIFALTMVGLIVLMFAKCGRVIECFFCCCKSPIIRIRKALLYNSILRLMIETYMPICLVTFIGL